LREAQAKFNTPTQAGQAEIQFLRDLGIDNNTIKSFMRGDQRVFDAKIAGIEPAGEGLAAFLDTLALVAGAASVGAGGFGGETVAGGSTVSGVDTALKASTAGKAGFITDLAVPASSKTPDFFSFLGDLGLIPSAKGPGGRQVFAPKNAINRKLPFAPGFGGSAGFFG